MRASPSLRGFLLDIPFTCLSATLPVDSLIDVCHLLGLNNPQLFLSGLTRTDIEMRVVGNIGAIPSLSNYEELVEMAMPHLATAVEELEGNALVFCSTVAQSEAFAASLEFALEGRRQVFAYKYRAGV